MKHTHLEHRFVEQLPQGLKPGVLYICMEYATSAHRCCCGCGEEVVIPFTPTDWSMTFDGETVSFSPSIGNWNFTCRSHYFIQRGRVIEAPTWTEKKLKKTAMLIDLSKQNTTAYITRPKLLKLLWLQPHKQEHLTLTLDRKSGYTVNGISLLKNWAVCLSNPKIFESVFEAK